MTYEKVSNHYKKTSIATAGKLELVVMCYEKTMQLIKQAKDHLEENEIEKKAQKIQKAFDIINELQTCLNMEQGGQIAKNLDAIYTYLIQRLLFGDINRDYTVFDECINILSELNEAWKTLQSDDQQQPLQNTGPKKLNLPQIAA